MDPYERRCVSLPLDGAYNVRDLGGHPTANGGHTCFHRFLRSDGLSLLTPSDEQFLYDYGVRSIVDLREPQEIDLEPDRPVAPDVVSAQIPLFEYNITDIEQARGEFDPTSTSLASMYRHILGNYESIRTCLRFIAHTEGGCVLFHCSAGKDRTGVLAMLLLSLAGVDRQDIIADYAQSQSRLMRSPTYAAQWNNPSLNAWQPLLDSPAEAMEKTLDFLEDEHGGVANYLLACGVPDEDVAAIRRHLVDA